MDMITFRRSVLERNRAIRGEGLEIGAFARPTVNGNVAFLDFFTTEELRAQASASGGDPDAVVPVEFVVRGEDYRDQVTRQFDYIIANHVFEHIVNPVAWLAMLCNLLKPEGYLLLTIPDRTPKCFDRFRQPTTFAHIMWDYLSDLTHEQKAWVHAVDTNLYYDRAFAGQTITPEQLFNVENIKKAKHHPGVHCHVFQADTFVDRIMKPLLKTRVVDFSLIDFAHGAQWGEFCVLLRKGWTPVDLTLAQFYGQREPSQPTQGEADTARLQRDFEREKEELKRSP